MSFHFRAADPGDGEAVGRLIATGYGSSARRSGLGSSRYWRWRHAGTGAESHSSLAVHEPTGAVAAYVGGVALRTSVRGEIVTGTISCDNVVAPEHRAGLARLGLFARLVNHWTRAWFGPGRDLLGWGFPSSTNLRIGERLCKYSMVRPMNVLWRELAAGRPWRARGVHVTVEPRAGSDADELWQRVRPELPLAVVRDRRYLDWRYADHPLHRYELLAARSDGTADLRALAVLRVDCDEPGVAALVDWLAPAEDVDAARALLQACADAARERGLGTLVAHFPETSPWFLRFQREGFLVRDSSILMVARTWRPGPSLEDLRRGLYVTFGDVDYL